MIRIAFTPIGGEGWTGGRNYLLNLLRVLSTHQADLIKPLLFVGTELGEAEVAPFANLPGVEVLRIPALDSRRDARALLRSLIWGYDPETRAQFHKHGVNIVFEAARFFGWRLGLPAIAWMPDFQHRDMPGMFARASLLKRELGFRAQILSGRFIMVSSAHARAACERYYPSTVGRTFTVRFAVPPAIGVEAVSARRIADSYSLPEQYVYMPNQFWRHKNHLVVIEALTILRAQARSVTVVASGSQLDPRNPGHFELLSTMIRERNLSGQFRILGMVPREHVLALMYASVAMLNPSHYEGWSTSVEEARSMGTALILSDIPVHREQAGLEAAYFNPDNSSELASILGNLVPLPAEACSARRAAAAAAATRRVQEFSDDFAQVALQCARTA